MKISKIIEFLQEILDEEGDLEVYTAKDDEMNGFNSIFFSPTVFMGEVNKKRLEYVVGFDESEENKNGLKKVVVI